MQVILAQNQEGKAMISPRWKKILRDLWGHKLRTVLVVLSIAVGIFAFSTIATARANVLKRLRDSYLSINPVSATITTEPFPNDLVDVIRDMEGVATADGQRVVPARIQTGPNTWYDLELYVIPDDSEDMTVNVVQPEMGDWPPPDHALLIERSSLSKTHTQVGDQVTVEVVGGETRTLPLAGLAYDLSLPPAPIAGKAFGYINFDTLEWFGISRAYNQVQIVVAEQRENKEHIWQVAEQVADKIERSGREVEVTDVPEPLEHPAEMILPTILMILSILGVLTLVLGMFLIVNTIEAILAQQVKQIGIMKAVGARSSQIIGLYAGMVVVFGLMALALAMPLGTLGALAFTRFLAGQLNVDVVDFAIPPPVLFLKVAAALLLPLLTTIPAIRAAARTTVREALSFDGAAPSRKGAGQIERIIQRIRGLPRPLMLSLRNTFRRKGRLLRTVAVLTLGGAIFISVLTVRASLFTTLDASIASKQYDVEVRFSRSYRSARVEPLALNIPGVVNVESWSFAKAYPVRPDGSEGEEIRLYAPPATTEMLKLRISQGRWLYPNDDNAIVVSSNYLSRKEPDTRLGDEIVLSIDGEEYTWYVVGVSQEFMSPIEPAIGYVNYDAFARTAGNMGRVDNLQITTAQHDPAFQRQIVRKLEQRTHEANLHVRLIESTSEKRAILNERFNILTAVLSIMATLIATVGSIGLTGTMSINVIERTREIGIMRAIGASDGMIRLIVIAEGIIIGLLSWMVATLLSLPLSKVMSYQIGYNLLHEPLVHTYASYAVGVWLVLVTLLATLASLLPARNALRITIREVLAYE
jgi:putative ABC transport system permease protein